MLQLFRSDRFAVNTKNLLRILGCRNVCSVPLARMKINRRPAQRIMRWVQMFCCRHPIHRQKRKMVHRMLQTWPVHSWLCLRHIIHMDRRAHWCAIIKCNASTQCPHTQAHCANIEAVLWHRLALRNTAALGTDTISKIQSSSILNRPIHNSSISCTVSQWPQIVRGICCIESFVHKVLFIN